MKFGCECGDVVSDNSDFLPWKGHFYSDQDYDAIWQELENAIFKSGPTPADKEKAIHELMLFLGRVGSLAYQCRNCGRLYIYEFDKNKPERKLEIFNPASPATSKEIFRSRPLPAEEGSQPNDP